MGFANADGGELLIGVEDDATVSGVPHKDSLVDLMKSAHKSHVHPETPLPTPLIGQSDIEGKRILYFSVGKSPGPIHLTSDGRCLQRLDRENRPVAAEQIQSDRQELLSREYDRNFVDGATTPDLELRLIERAAANTAQGYSAEKILQYFGLAEYTGTGLRLRRAALLLFGTDIARWHPRCSVRIVRVNGTELGVGNKYDVTHDELITGNILKLLEDVWDALRPYLARTRFQVSGLFRESLIYPEAACREALVNAIAHRDYSRQGNSVEVYVFDDHMELRSPGGLLSSVSLHRLSNLEGVHESRNVLIARALRELGYMREMGEGIPRIFRAMRESDLVDPALEVDRDIFKVTLQHRSIFTQHDIEWLEGFAEFDLDKNEQRVVLLGRDGHLLSTNEIIKVAGIVDIDDFRALSERLRMKGLLYNARPRLGGAGRRREIGRFQVRAPKEAGQYFGELLAAVRSIGPAATLKPADARKIRSQLSQKSPYAELLHSCLQSLGLVDGQKRFLPKVFTYVPELQGQPREEARAVYGEVKAVKPEQYGFIRADDGTEYFFRKSTLNPEVRWDALERGTRVCFRVEPARTREQKDVAADVRLAQE